MKYILQFLFYGLNLIFVECVLEWEVVHHKTNAKWEEADAICKSNGQELAVVDSEEKWEKVKNVITGGNRYTAEADVFIGLTFDTNINNYTWNTGVAASWTKWFENEPYYTETRHCVRMDVYANYFFRTTDCAYNHHFVCSYEDLVTTTASQSLDHSNVRQHMIVGLSVGFGIFMGIGILICLMCRCCCTFPERKYRSKPNGCKIKPTRAVATSQYEIFMNQTDNRPTSSISAFSGKHDYHKQTGQHVVDFDDDNSYKTFDNFNNPVFK